MINNLAEIFGVSTKALTVPDIDNYKDLMNALFTLEDLYGLKIAEIDGKVCLHLDNIKKTLLTAKSQ